MKRNVGRTLRAEKEKNIKSKFKINNRIIVSSEGGWEKDFPGIIVSLPEFVKTVQGDDYFYWVKFDHPQNDLTKDGPYSMGQILSRYLRNEN